MNGNLIAINYQTVNTYQSLTREFFPNWMYNYIDEVK